MKRVISSNNVPLILNGKYAWKIINDPQYGEYFHITLGNPYIDIKEDCYEMDYFPKDNKLNVYLGIYSYYGSEIPRMTLMIEFKNTEMIIDGLLKANPRMRLLPLYNSNEYYKNKRNTIK